MTPVLWVILPLVVSEPPLPEGTSGEQAPVSSGQTEIEGQGKFAAATGRDVATADDALELDVRFGGFLSTGNARSLAITGATNLRVRRRIHQFMSSFVGNYGRAAIDDRGWETNVGNAQGRARYDVFFAKRWSAFLMTTARHDPFLELRLRLNVDPGIAFWVLAAPKHRFWIEAGYDFQYDLRTEDVLYQRDDDGNFVLDATGNRIRDPDVDQSEITHAARAFTGYSNHVDDRVSLDTGLEYLQSVTEGRRWRLNFDVAATIQLANKLSMATTFTLRIDNDPLPGVRKVDTITAIQLVYRFI